MVMWVCEAWQVNIWTVFAVRPNGPNKKNNFASSRSDHLGSDKKGFIEYLEDNTGDNEGEKNSVELVLLANLT